MPDVKLPVFDCPTYRRGDVGRRCGVSGASGVLKDLCGVSNTGVEDLDEVEQ